MPGFDGSGPRGHGPMTGRGEGYCVMVLPDPGSKEAPHGFAGVSGRPIAMARRPILRARRNGWTVNRRPHLRPWFAGRIWPDLKRNQR
jgi:hypothetical protein